jgi:uncharacterized membrane protein
MKNHQGLATFTAVVAIFLLIEGGWAVWTIDAVRQLEVVPGTPFATADDVAWAKSYLPAMYVVATEGLLFGAIAIIGTVGLLMKKPWAHRMLLLASILLALTAAIAIGMAPRKWETQGVFIVFCALLWWQSRKCRRD